MDNKFELKKEWVLFGYALKSMRRELLCLEDQFKTVGKHTKSNRYNTTLAGVITEFDKYISTMDDDLAISNIFEDSEEFVSVFYGDSDKLLHKYCKEI